MEQDLLAISGLKHLAFCSRRWALVHMEQLWQENASTAEGHVLHERVHGQEKGLRKGKLEVRGLELRSQILELYGVADLVEFLSDPSGIELAGHKGRWRPFPVEYKLGRPHDSDRLQLCAQALCLEEMLHCQINSGALFYGANRRRDVVTFTPEQREQVAQRCFQAREILYSQSIPKPEMKPHCRKCSLLDLCKPSMIGSAKGYIQRFIEEALNETPSEHTLLEH